MLVFGNVAARRYREFHEGTVAWYFALMRPCGHYDPARTTNTVLPFGMIQIPPIDLPYLQTDIK